jgi:hypothetical protein
VSANASLSGTTLAAFFLPSAEGHPFRKPFHEELKSDADDPGAGVQDVTDPLTVDHCRPFRSERRSLEIKIAAS